MRFEKLFSLKIAHDYFKDSLCNDLLILPTEECYQLIKNYKLILKNDGPGSLYLATVKAREDVLPVEPIPNVSFDFFIFLLNPDFIQYTKFIQKKKDEIYLFSTNNVDSKNDGNLLPSVMKKPLKTLATNHLLIGLVQVTDSNPSATYTIQFSSAATNWKYYVLTGNNLPNVNVDGSLAGVDFTKRKLEKKPPDIITRALQMNYPNANVFVFESQTEVPYQQKGKKDIQLINTDKKSILVNHLPNPSFNENGIKIINIIN